MKYISFFAAFVIVILLAIDRWNLKMSRWNLVWMVPLGFVGIILASWLASNL